MVVKGGFPSGGAIFLVAEKLLPCGKQKLNVNYLYSEVIINHCINGC